MIDHKETHSNITKVHFYESLNSPDQLCLHYLSLIPLPYMTLAPIVEVLRY